MFQIYEKEQNTLYRIMEKLFLRPFFLNKKTLLNQNKSKILKNNILLN